MLSNNFHESFIKQFNTIKDFKTKTDIELINIIRLFIKADFDDELWKIGNLKGKLYEHVVDFSTIRGKSSLRQEAKDYLLVNARDLVVKLPEHEESPFIPEKEKGTLDHIINDKKEVFSPVLDSLIRRDVFKMHSFVFK